MQVVWSVICAHKNSSVSHELFSLVAAMLYALRRRSPAIDWRPRLGALLRKAQSGGLLSPGQRRHASGQQRWLWRSASPPVAGGPRRPQAKPPRAMIESVREVYAKPRRSRRGTAGLSSDAAVHEMRLVANLVKMHKSRV